jgi:VanZ family protein
LIEQEVSQHYHGWKNSGEEGLVAFYPLDEGFGQWGYDRAGRHNLFIPPRFEVLQKTILTPLWKDFRLNRSYLTDILTNILGFIPFGFFFSAYLRIKKPRSIYQLFFITILFAGCMSLTIELVQGYLPTRSSQLTDVIMNILGTAIGVALFLKYRKALGVRSEVKGQRLKAQNFNES